MTGRRARLPLGDREAARPEAHLPRPRHGDGSCRSSSSSSSCSKTGGPNDVPLGRYIRDTGLAVPFVVLFFMSIWGLPLVTALVAGDIVASESHNGTLKTILTRSRDRGEVFAGKVLATSTYTVALVFAMGLVGLVAGSVAWGFHPLTSLSGTKVSAGHGLRAAVREPRHLHARARRDRRVRRAALDRDAQQRSVGRRLR